MPEIPDYRLEVTYGDDTFRVDDPYRYWPSLGDIDLHLIGEGGTARVYLASREDDDEPLVVKILRHEIVTNKKALERFMEEYAMVERIQSRHVARIVGHGNSDNDAYLVMEFFEGGDLNKRLAGQAVAPPEALRFFRELMFALGDIHEKGILHRDLKPQNLMFRRDGSLAIVDFGIAKNIAAADRTNAGEVLGTPRYMSPEQVQGRALDLRTDIYSAGVLLYQMLTGRVPFEGASDFAILKAQIDWIPLPAGAVALSAWTMLSILWSSAPDQSWVDGNETMLSLAALAVIRVAELTHTADAYLGMLLAGSTAPLRAAFRPTGHGPGSLMRAVAVPGETARSERPRRRVAVRSARKWVAKAPVNSTGSTCSMGNGT